MSGIFKYIVSICILTFAISANANEFSDGMKAYRSGDYALARSKLLPLAKAGHTRAMNNMGLIFKNGLGVPKDLNQSFKYFLQSSQQGFSLAQYNLAGMYQKGLGTKRSPEKAIEWMRKAADNKFARAQLVLGIWYERGFGVPRDPIDSLMWYFIAQGNSKGKFRKTVEKRLFKLKKALSDDQIKAASEAAKGYMASHSS
jgi:hypothetical protein